MKRNDILQSSLNDGHRKLGYKILTGFVWAAKNCAITKVVGKTDDNVVLNMERLMYRLEERRWVVNNRILCGSGPPHRNMKTLRSEKPHMLGNWSVSKDQMEEDIVPDFCAGFLYLTSPKVGAELVQVGAALFGDKDVTIIEDSLITGVLRQRLQNVSIDMLVDTTEGKLWLNFLSYCPWLTVAKLTFFDEIVLNKTSSRSGVQYVGSIIDPGVWRFFICLHVEVALESVNQWIPNILPDIFWDICAR